MNPPANPAPTSPAARFRTLEGADLARYAEAAAALALAGRLNKCFPDPYGVAAYFQALSPAVRGAYGNPVAVDLGSGLPTLKELVEVQADGELADQFLREVQDRAAGGRPLTDRVAAKRDYYARLKKLPLRPLHSLEVRLRRVDADRGVAAFEVVFERYDPAEVVFVRYTLLLEQKDGAWGDRLIARSGDYSGQTQRFREAMEKYLQDDSELAFLFLGKSEGLRVEEVTRARIGPLWSPWTGAPKGWFPDSGPSFILHLPTDRASVDLDEDRDNDPFATLYRNFLSAENRPLIADEARRLGYRIHKERKFVCPAGAAENLQARLREAGTRNIVYTV